MCGITGLFRPGMNPDFHWIWSATEALKNRGPDDEGYLAYNSQKRISNLLIGQDSQIEGQHLSNFKEDADLFLGHRRLSILDLSYLGHQPMSNAQKTIWIVYNGEIYNYLDLRRELQNSGYLFKTKTDTEVLLAAYEEWGEDCLDRLDGMWAFVLLDTKKNILFGSRDRFGVKPLYYFYNRQSFAFASEIKALLQLPFITRAINPEAAFDFLAFGWIENEEESIFQGINELYPSHAFRLDLASNTLKIWQYYELAYNKEWHAFDLRQSYEFAQETRELLQNAIASHIVSDVPTGSCLSGGMDSSTIVCMVNNLLKKDHPRQIGEKQKVFTISYQAQKDIDESDWAQEVVAATSTSWFKFEPNVDDIQKNLNDIVFTQDIPFPSMSGVIPQYLLMRIVQDEGIKVLLDGQGGDELFAGYRGFFLSSFSEKIRKLAFNDIFRESSHIKNSPVSVSFILNSMAKVYIPHIMPLNMLTSFMKQTRREFQYLDTQFIEHYKDRVEIYKERHFHNLNQDLHDSITSPNFKYLLRYADRNSMRFSIEARAPFADHRKLIEFIFQIPGNYKIYKGWSKYLLRQATIGLIPERIRWRKDKLGFPAPESQLLKSIHDQLVEQFSEKGDEYLNIKKILLDLPNLINKPSAASYNPFLWRAFIFKVWRGVFKL